jgi:hypothetical protein
VDGVLGVVGIGQTQQAEVKRVWEQLQAFRLPCIGLVANSPSPARTQVADARELPPAADSPEDDDASWSVPSLPLHPEVDLHERSLRTKKLEAIELPSNNASE